MKNILRHTRFPLILLFALVTSPVGLAKALRSAWRQSRALVLDGSDLQRTGR
jgi:hypothetical protein